MQIETKRFDVSNRPAPARPNISPANLSVSQSSGLALLFPTPQPEPIAQQGVPLLAVTGCRFPVSGDAPSDYLFCDAVKVDGRPYCKEHMARRLP